MHQTLHEGHRIMVMHLVHSAAPTPLERLVDDYLAHCQARGLSPRTINNNYGYALLHVFLPWCAQRGVERVSELDGRGLDHFTSSLLQRQRNGRPISKHTVHSYVRPIRQMLTWASQVGEEVNAKPQLPRRPKPVHDVLGREEIDRLERIVYSERDKIIVRVLGDCGLRLNELAQLTPSNIVRSSGRHAFLRVLGKGERIREVPLPPLLLRRMERLIDARPLDRSDDRIFLASRRSPAGEFEPLLGTGIHQMVQDAGIRAGLSQRVHAHMLRHSWMTEMLRQGMNPLQLSLIAGTSLPVIMEHYTHLTKDDAYDAMIAALRH